MKRVLTLLFILVLSLSLGMSALADVIYEPEDDFFEKHRDECYYENRVYIADGEEGHATVMKNPKSNKTMEELPNGTEVYVGWMWGKDGGWALLEGRGWVRMSELTVKYDGISFTQEHGAEFLYLEEWEFLDLTDCDCVQLWRYPGDEAPFTSLSWKGEDAWFREAPDDLSFNTIYESGGVRWGYIHYYYGYRDCWVCLTYPDAEWLCGTEPALTETEPSPAPTQAPGPTAAPASPAPAPASPQPAELPPIIDPAPPQPTLWGPALLAVGAMAVAGGLLAVFRRKK